jgi:2-polyprenyl-3-methyl-5-hydroxy-6-metoxy-1,4-benzoquinol methylase
MPTAAATLFSLVTKAAKGDARAQSRVKQVLDQAASPSMLLAEEAVSNAGSKTERETLRAHRLDYPWCLHMRLELQEFAAVFPQEVHFEVGIRGAISNAAWGYEHARALGNKGVTASQRLLADMHAVASEAAAYAARVTELRSRITPLLHALQVLTLMRAEAAIDSWAGKRVLEVGPQDGGLFAHLRAQGVDVWALDLEPRFKDPRLLVGDFMKETVPGGGFDVVLATAVFEYGSGWEHPPQTTTDDEKLLQRLHKLLNPGGVVVMENIGCPVVFGARAAEANGFEVLNRRTLVHNLAESGRGCTLRRR